MATTKTKTTTKRARKDDGVYWVVSTRNRWMRWVPLAVCRTEKLAIAYRNLLEQDSILGIEYAKVNRVTLLKELP